MKSLIFVSNKLPFLVNKNEDGQIVRVDSSSGGLLKALIPLIIKTNGFWVGWAGKDLVENMPIPESNDSTSFNYDLKSSRVVPVILNEETHSKFFDGMCNSSLYPLLHSLPTHTEFKSDYWNSYVEANTAFSNSCLETLKKYNQTESQNQISEKNLVWIHDYHLFMMPMILKNQIEEASISCNIVFFLHVPFPSWDIFRLNPWAKEILLGLLGCDLIVFHTNTYAINFLDCCFYILGSRIDKQDFIIEYGNKIIIVRALPIGINYDWFEQQARMAPKNLCFVKEKVILCVDRLDYTKGIIQRVHGYERFLEKYPEFIEKVAYFQVIMPSKRDSEEYKHLKDEFEREIGRANGRFGTSEWTPIKYIYKRLTQYELTGYYRDSAIALITPIRDGMNLVAKEYVACQIDDPGVLIISPFTGAGETMLEALSVNPLEADMLADCIKKAFEMNYHERKLRINALKTRERLFNLDTWIDSFFEACELIDSHDVLKMQTLSINDIESWLGPIVNGYKLTLILDYDGTLVPLKPHPDLAILSDDVKEYLEQLIAIPEIDVCLLSGRSLENLKKMVQIKNINLAGSHALELELADGKQFFNEQAELYRVKIPELVSDLEKNVCRYGGWIEQKVYHTSFHWRETDVKYRDLMKKRAKEIIENHGFQYLEGHYVSESRPPIGWDKGRGAFHILEKLHGYTWADNVRVVFIGDDNTDEDAMRALAGLGITFRVGRPNITTNATHRLPNTDSVKVFLQWAVQYMNQRKEFEKKNERRNQGMSKKRALNYTL